MNYYMGAFVALLLLLGCVRQTNTLAAQANVKLAIALLHQGYPVEAKKKLLLAKQLNADEPSVWYGMGFYNETVGEINQARNDYEHAIEINPSNGASHNNYGVFLCRLGQYQQSIDEFLLAVKDSNYLETGFAYKNASICALQIPDQKQAEIFSKKSTTITSLH